METTSISICLVFVVVMMGLAVEGQGGLKTGFYSSSRPKAEDVVRSTVEAHFNKDPSVAAGLLRLHFHDCFVQGCDGSVLIKGASAERNALPNLGLRGFEVIDDAKSQLESSCPGVVSSLVRDGNAILESDVIKGRLGGDTETQRIVKKYAGSIRRGLLGFRFHF